MLINSSTNYIICSLTTLGFGIIGGPLNIFGRVDTSLPETPPMPDKKDYDIRVSLLHTFITECFTASLAYPTNTVFMVDNLTIYGEYSRKYWDDLSDSVIKVIPTGHKTIISVDVIKNNKKISLVLFDHTKPTKQWVGSFKRCDECLVENGFSPASCENSLTAGMAFINKNIAVRYEVVTCNSSMCDWSLSGWPTES